MYTMSVIGLLIFPAGFFIALVGAEDGGNIGVLQILVLLCAYGFILSLVGLIHSIRCRKKNKSMVRQFRSDDPSTYLTNLEQQKALLLETIDMEMERNNKEISQIQKKINKYVEPEIDENINKISENRVRYETLRSKRKAPEFFEKNNSNVNSGLAGILAMSKRNKD